MDLTNIKLVITDMDGTLLNSNHEVSKQFLNLFYDLKKEGIYFVAASGRPYYSILDKLQTIKDEITIVAENGAYVVHDNEVLSNNIISPKSIAEISKTIYNLNGTHPIYCTRKKAYIMDSSLEIIQIIKEYYSDFQIINHISEIKDDVIKIALYNDVSAEKYIFPNVSSLAKDFKVIVSGQHWVDISDYKSNKGEALKLLQKKFNVLPEEILAFGDYNNDLEMLSQSKYSFAMANAHPNVKAIAKYETLSNNDLGVEIVLADLISQKNQTKKSNN